MTRDQLASTLPQGQGSGKQSPTAKELSPEQQRQVRELQQIDRAVRAHEQAHITAGRGVVTSGANFSYAYGPDGKQYAVGGEVSIDTSAERKPEANIDKGRRIQVAALAPADPSPQDHRVAAIGAGLEEQGYLDLERQRLVAMDQGDPPAQPPSAATTAVQSGQDDRQRQVARAYEAAPTESGGGFSRFA
ncbi:hypothetical protein B9N43_10045 [Denitratisoma sp. DHT3]|nr:hypothetical protein B9N43_10045 [Denitratisoma sp. DHT3]